LPQEGRAVLDDSTIAKPHSETIEGVKAYSAKTNTQKTVPDAQFFNSLLKIFGIVPKSWV
jgi:hypothetical protein